MRTLQVSPDGNWATHLSSPGSSACHVPLGPAKHRHLHQLAEEGSKAATPALGYARVTIWLPRPARAWQGRHAGLEAWQGLLPLVAALHEGLQ